MDKCDIIDVKDGECELCTCDVCNVSIVCVAVIVVTHNGTGIRNAWKMNNADKDDKVYILYTKSSHAKQQWMNAFMNERQTVQEDNERGVIN